MKKAALYIALVCMFGCGAGGGTGSSNSGAVNPPGGSTSGVTLKTFTLKLVERAPGAAKSTVDPGAAVPIANSLRVIARQVGTLTIPVVDDNGVPVDPPAFITIPGAEVYKKVIDLPYTPGSNVTVNLPAGTGYTIDVITNVVDGSGKKHIMLKYGTITGVNIGDVSSTASVPISAFSDPLTPLVDIQASPDPITSEENYNLTVTAGKPLRFNYKIRQDLNNVAFANYSSKKTGSSGATVSFKAPTSFVDGPLYFQGLFTIDDTMLTTGELSANWTRVYPNPAYGESVSIALKKVLATSIGGL